MTDPVGRLSDTLAGRRLRLALAESCTGGLLAARLTDRAGASRFLEAGLVTYSDQAKVALLGVRTETLDVHGAVSEAVAGEMLAGARARTGAEAAIAITGIAGPDGGTPDKPVGTVWVGAALEDASRLREFRFHGDRNAIRDASVMAAVAMLQELVEMSQ